MWGLGGAKNGRPPSIPAQPCRQFGPGEPSRILFQPCLGDGATGQPGDGGHSDRPSTNFRRHDVDHVTSSTEKRLRQCVMRRGRPAIVDSESTQLPREVLCRDLLAPGARRWSGHASEVAEGKRDDRDYGATKNRFSFQ
jgi:hypothetical protein